MRYDFDLSKYGPDVERWHNIYASHGKSHTHSVGTGWANREAAERAHYNFETPLYRIHVIPHPIEHAIAGWAEE